MTTTDRRIRGTDATSVRKVASLALDLDDLARVLDAMLDAAKDEGPALMADVIREDTMERSARGVDPDDAPWPGYSARHAKKRQSLGLQTSRVDHRMSGDMLGNYAFNPYTSMLEVPDITLGGSLTDTDEPVSLLKKALGTNALRPWVRPSVIAIELGALAIAERMMTVE
jgi:hypothetical protein